MAFRNLLIRAAPVEAVDLLRPLMQRIDLRKGEIMLPADEPCRWAIFPENGIVSIVNRTVDGREIEVGIVGRDGMAGLPLVLGTGSAPHRAFVQVEGTAHRVPADAFCRVLQQSPALNALLLRYTQAFMVQVSETVLFNGIYTIEERLARWLLLVHNRLDGNDVPLTHEFLSIMLGVRRTGVTLAIHVLEGSGMIKARRGLISIVDRSKLTAAANAGYGPGEAEYERLIGPLRQAADERPDLAAD